MLIISVIGSVLTIAGFFGIRYHSKVSEPPSTKNRSGITERHEIAQAPVPGVRSSPVTFQELMHYVYQEVHTDIQREEFLDRHLGRRVTWEGWVGGVSDHREKGVSALITANEDSSYYVAFLSFPQEDKPQLASLSFGQRIRVTCTFENFDAQAHLKDCELLKVWSEEKESGRPRGDRPTQAPAADG